MEQTHRYFTVDHQMNLVFSENKGAYLNKINEKMIPLSNKKNISELEGNIEEKSEVNKKEI